MRFTLRIRMIIYFVVAAVLPTLALGLVETLERQNTERREAKQNLYRQARSVAFKAEILLKDACGDVELAASLRFVRSFPALDLIDPARRGIPQDADPETRDVLDSLRSKQEGVLFDYTFLVTNLGDVYALSPRSQHETLPWSNYSFRQWFQAVWSARQTAISNVFISTAPPGKAVVHIATPVRADDGTFVGVLGGALQLGELTRIVDEVDQLNAASQIHTHIVDQSGRIVTSDPAHDAPVDLTERAEVMRVLSGEQGSLETTAHSTKYLAGYYPVQARGVTWGVVTEQPEKVALAWAHRLRNEHLAAALGAASIAGLAGALIARTITKPIRRLQSTAQKVSLGEMSARAKITGDDEITDMTVAFNKMIEDVERYRQRIVGRSHELERMNQRLQELDQLKSEFLANISHELRTPLNAILGFSDLALRRKGSEQLPEKTAHFIERVRVNAAELLGMVDRLLKLTRIETGDFKASCVRFQLKPLVQHCIDQVHSSADAKDLDLHVEMPDDFPDLHTDPDLLREIIVNLLHNGIKFTREGEVVLHAEHHAETIGTPPDHVTRHFAVIRVSDTGIGIAPGDVSKVFDAFRQVDGSISREHGGMGVGLAIARRLTELLHGEITVHSEVGVGSTFTVKLPIDLTHWPT